MIQRIKKRPTIAVLSPPFVRCSGAAAKTSGRRLAASPDNAARLFFALRRVVPVAAVVLGALVAASVAASACGGTSTDDAQKLLKVVASTSLLADLVKNVGGPLVEVYSVVPPGADVHSFQTTPQDSMEIGQAEIIVTNGSGLDDFLEPVITSAARGDEIRVVTSEGLERVAIEETEPSQGNLGKLAEPSSVERNPHFWQNPIYAIHYVERIRDGLVEADQANAEPYRNNAAEYIRQLRELDQEIAEILADVPLHRRHLMTFHDAFAYFAAHYGWRVSSLVSHDVDVITPSAITAMMERVRKEGVPAVFAEPQFQSEAIAQVAKDAEVRLGTIYSDVLDDDVATYVDMMRFNAMSLAEHLR